VAYLLDSSKYLVIGHKPYLRDGELKQSAAAHDDLKTALDMLDEHEKQFIK